MIHRCGFNFISCKIPNKLKFIIKCSRWCYKSTRRDKAVKWHIKLLRACNRVLNMAGLHACVRCDIQRGRTWARACENRLNVPVLMHDAGAVDVRTRSRAHVHLAWPTDCVAWWPLYIPTWIVRKAAAFKSFLPIYIGFYLPWISREWGDASTTSLLACKPIMRC